MSNIDTSPAALRAIADRLDVLALGTKGRIHQDATILRAVADEKDGDAVYQRITDRYLRETGLAQPQPVPAIPPGWRLVPEEPTPEMVNEGSGARHNEAKTSNIYRAMLAAAPQPPAFQDVVTAEEQERARDSERLDWLERKVVNVRQPLRYGSGNMFWSSLEDLDGDTGPSDIRRQIDAAMAQERKEGA